MVPLARNAVQELFAATRENWLNSTTTPRTDITRIVSRLRLWAWLPMASLCARNSSPNLPRAKYGSGGPVVGGVAAGRYAWDPYVLGQQLCRVFSEPPGQR